MWKNCQEASLQTEVMTHDSKGLPNQNTQRIFGVVSPSIWYSDKRGKEEILV
jgi:hypothetical protein